MHFQNNVRLKTGKLFLPEIHCEVQDWPNLRFISNNEGIALLGFA